MSDRDRPRAAGLIRSGVVGPAGHIKEHLAKMVMDAERVVAKATKPKFTHADYEQDTLDLARYEADGVGSTAKAFASLIDAGDERMDALYKAAEAAKAGTYSNARREKAWDLIEKQALSQKRKDESLEAALSRLLEEDPTAREAHAYYDGR